VALGEANLFCFNCLFISVSTLEKSNYHKRGKVVIPLIGLSPPYFCVCPSRGSEIPTPYVMVVLVYNVLRLEVIVRFVDTPGIWWSSLFKL